MNSHVSRSLIFAFICVIVSAFPAVATGPDQTPSGIVQTPATLDQVLAAHDKAMRANKWTTSVEEGTLTEYGLTGTYHSLISNDDEKWSETIGGFTTRSGTQNGQGWYQNENGIVTLEHGVHQSSEVAAETFANHARSNNEGLSLAGESLTPAAYVIEVHVKGGRHEWRYYDKKTYQLVRLESVHPTSHVITTYGDYRTIDGVTSPWHVHSSDGHKENDTDYVTTSLHFNVPIAPGDLDIPQSNTDFVEFPAGAQSVKLPVKILDPGRIIVQVTIGDRGYDFQLDSGASSILMDSGLIKKLNLTPRGASLQHAGGAYTQSQAIVPEMSIGGIRMKNVVVDTSDYLDQEDTETKVYGLIGFDFIANAALKIDYEKHTVEAIPPYLFVPPAEGSALDALWDDGVPRIGVSVNEVPANFILDTGADDGVIFQQFANAHPDAVKDQGLGSRLSSYYGFFGASGVGGDFQTKPIQVKEMTLASIRYSEFLMQEVINNPGFEGEDYDGLLGYEMLKYFTVYLDYKDLHVYLVRNGVSR